MKKYFNISGIILCLVIMMLFVTPLTGQDGLTYQSPPKGIADLIDTPGTPYVSVSPDRKTLLIIERPSLPPISEVSQPELKLAGIRINPRTNNRARVRHYNNIRFIKLSNRKEYLISGLPKDPQISNFSWSPDSSKVAITITDENGLALWTVSATDGQATKLTPPVLNGAIYGRPYQWMPDSQRILFRSVKKNRGNVPQKDPVPLGPVVQSNTGKAAPVRTFQDLLKNKHDEDLFSYYATSQLMVAEAGKESREIGKPGIFSTVSLSPNGKYILVESVKKPFSYLVPYYRFPLSIEIWDTRGMLVKQVASIPLAEDIPKGYSSCRKGPRDFTWRYDAPAILYWAEAQDGGDPRKKADIRDTMFHLEAPFNGNVKKGPSLKYRFGNIKWGNGNLAIISDWWWSNRKQRTIIFRPDHPGKPVEVIFDRSWEDRYNEPGYFVTSINQYGKNVLLTGNNGQSLYLIGAGASPEGDRPFIDRFDLKTQKTRRLWRSKAPYYERIVSIIDIRKNTVLTSREGKKIQPNYFIRNLKTGRRRQITKFPHPYPALKDVVKQQIKYKRADGLELDGDLYLPVGYKKSNGPLPVILWAYPVEYKSKAAAGQVQDSPYRFIYLYWGSPILWITEGYAVFDGAKMPIVGEGDEEPNDTYVEQLVSDAKAAIDKLAEMGIADRNRVAVGGHSYGAFMVANLLSHSNLFAAGIARSGAYNRTLTPFGFQAEERTFWEAPETYFKMSPFMHAHKVKTPILLIHGDMDNNSGTFPIQSKRYYHALKGHGATVRLVMLPFESHGYRARESIMHVAWETYQWLEKYVKNKRKLTPVPENKK